MTDDIRDQLVTLSNLQRIEIEMARYEKELAAVDGRIAVLNQEVQSFKGQVDAEHGRIEELRKNYRENEVEIKSIENRIEQRNGQLRSVKTNKEYQSMLKEIEEMGAKKSALEDQTLSTLEEIEAADKKMAIAIRDLEDLRQETDQRAAAIRAAAESQREALERLTQERRSVAGEMTPHLQKLFDRAKKQGRGIAVAAVIDAVCQVCCMNIPPQMYNELLRMDSLRTCPNCQRIIYPKTFIDD